MKTTLGEPVPSYNVIAEIKCGPESIKDDFRSHQHPATTEENIRKLCDLVMKDQTLTTKETILTIAFSFKYK